jgi:PII interaction protein X
MKPAQVSSGPSPAAANPRTGAEIYLNHPTFGLLYQVCTVVENKDLYATLYAQRLFFVVITGPQGIQFDPISRNDARLMMEGRLRNLRREGTLEELNRLQAVYKQTFQ